MLPYITPYLSSRDYGIYGTLAAYSAAIFALKDLGLTTVLSVSYYKYVNRYHFIWNKIFTITSVWSFPLTLFLACIIWIVLPKEEAHYYWPVVIFQCLPLLLFEPTKWVGRKFFQLNQKPIPIVLINITASVLGVVATYLSINVFKLGYLGWFIASFVISLISFIPYLWILIRTIKIKFDFNFNKKWLYKYLAIGLPVLPHVASVYLLDTSDRLILNWYGVSLEEIGLYSMAYSLGAYFAIIGTALGDATGPMYIKLNKDDSPESDIKIRNLTFLMQFVLLFLAFIGGLWMKEFFQILIKNESLQVGYIITIIIIFSYTSIPIYFGAVNRLQFLYKTKALWKITFMAGIVNVILNLILVPFIGIWGSVIGTFIAQLYMSFSGYLLKEFKLVNRINFKPVLWVITILSLTGIVYLLKDVLILVKVILTLISICLAYYYITKNKKALLIE
jgi:O-antigen/teichoic acid export membrane protein